MVVLAGTGGYGAYLATTASGFLDSVFVAGPSEPPIDGRYNILLLGGDAGPDRDGLRPDSITRASSIDAETGQAVTHRPPAQPRVTCRSPTDSPLAAVYPEGYGSIDGCEVDVCLLNSIYTEVELMSPEMYPDAVAEGSEPGIEAHARRRRGRHRAHDPVLRAHRHAGLRSSSSTPSAASTINGRGRGPDRRADETTTSASAEWIEPGAQHLDGYHALWYARSRYGTSDYDRMAAPARSCRRRSSQQFNPANVLTKFQEVAAAGAQVVKTDIPQAMLGYFVDLASKTKELPIIDGRPRARERRRSEDPDYDYIRQLVAAAVAPPHRGAGRGLTSPRARPVRQRSACSCQTRSAGVAPAERPARSAPATESRSATASCSTTAVIGRRESVDVPAADADGHREARRRRRPRRRRACRSG